MSMRIVRRTGWLNMKAKIPLRINGEKVAIISYKQELDLNFSSDIATLNVSRFGIRSNQITIRSGDRIELKNSMWSNVSSVLLLLLLIIYCFTNLDTLKMSISTIVIVYGFISFFFLNTYRLEIVE